MSNTMIAPASTKQIAFIAKLCTERQHHIDDESLMALTKQRASLVIGELLARPRVVAAAPAPRITATPLVNTRVYPTGPLATGIYRTADGTIYRVKTSATGNRYANKLVPFHGERLTETGVAVQYRFEYDRGAIYTLRPEMKLSLDEAKAFGHRTGSCCVCARRLTDATSVANGIGPICAKGF